MCCKDYAFNVAVALDQLCNAICGGFPDETISSRCFRYSSRRWYARLGHKALDFVFSFWGADHCKHAYESELKRSQLFKGSGLPKKAVETI